MIQQDSDPAYVKACIVAYLNKLGCDDAESCYFLQGIEEGYITLEYDVLFYPQLNAIYNIVVFIKLEYYNENDPKWFGDKISRAFKSMHVRSNFDVNVSFVVIPDVAQISESGLNNTHFKTEKTITHDEVRFRSRAEIAVYEILRCRNVLFFPNPAAVLGREYPEEREKREPDFLICHRGKWGILEVSGEPWHSGQISTAKDHDRARLFQRYGLVCVQHYDSKRCQHSPADVVDEFLLLLTQS